MENTSSNVQRIVITSSCASVVTPGLSEPRVYTEEDWNTISVQEVKEKGHEASQHDKYRASKTLAEKGELVSRDISRARVKRNVSCLGLC